MKNLCKVKGYGDEKSVPITSELIKSSKKADLIALCTENNLNSRGTKEAMQGTSRPYFRIFPDCSLSL